MTGKTKRRIDTGQEAKIALEALREQATVADLMQASWRAWSADDRPSPIGPLILSCRPATPIENPS
jgi:hypothetical protein